VRKVVEVVVADFEANVSLKKPWLRMGGIRVGRCTYAGLRECLTARRGDASSRRVPWPLPVPRPIPLLVADL